MKPLSDLIHRTPWWALILGGVATLIALAVVVTPFHLIEYRHEGATPEENRAIKREIDNTFAEGALDVARSAILTMRGATSDPARREAPPASFAGIVQSMMTQALLYLGEIAVRGGEAMLDLDLAKRQIDMLTVLEEKTRGNLAPDEQKLLDSVLYDLRNRFVSTASQFIM